MTTMTQDTLRHQRTEYGVSVIPYDARNDPNSSKFLPWFWSRLVEDGLVSLYYPGQEDTGFAEFVKMFSGGAKILLVATKDREGKPDKAIGFVSWGDSALGNKLAAIAGFIFFKEFWDHRYSTDAANGAMKYWFTETDLQIAIGMVAEKNVMANRFLGRLGWERAGTLAGCHLWQGQECDSIMWTVTKSDFLKGGI